MRRAIAYVYIDVYVCVCGALCMFVCKSVFENFGEVPAIWSSFGGAQHVIDVVRLYGLEKYNCAMQSVC